AADEDDEEDRERSAPLEHPLFFDAALGVVNEIEERRAAQVAAGGRKHVEPVELCDGLARIRRYRLQRWNRPRWSGGFAVSERNLVEHFAMARRDWRARRHHAQRPLHVGGGGREAQV